MPSGNPVPPPQVRQAFLSLATILGNAITFREDIEPSELSVGVTFVGGDINYPSRYRIYIADTLDNGAGYSSSYSTVDSFETLLAYVESHLVPNYLTDNHQMLCRTSCPKCLRNYANRFDHGGLDWRLGLDLFELLKDQSSRPSTANPHWHTLLHGRLRELLSGLGQTCKEDDYQGVPIVVLENKNAILYPLHPLIGKETPFAHNLRQEIRSTFGDQKIVFYSPYELERKPIPEITQIYRSLKNG